VTGTNSDDLILVPTSGAMTGGTVDGADDVDELRFTSTGTAQTLTLGTSLTNVEQVVIGTTGATPSPADTSALTRRRNVARSSRGIFRMRSNSLGVAGCVTFSRNNLTICSLDSIGNN
jgi:hypothetical protein